MLLPDRSQRRSISLAIPFASVSSPAAARRVKRSSSVVARRESMASRDRGFGAGSSRPWRRQRRRSSPSRGTGRSAGAAALYLEPLTLRMLRCEARGAEPRSTQHGGSGAFRIIPSRLSGFAASHLRMRPRGNRGNKGDGETARTARMMGAGRPPSISRGRAASRGWTRTPGPHPTSRPASGRRRATSTPGPSAAAAPHTLAARRARPATSGARPSASRISPTWASASAAEERGTVARPMPGSCGISRTCPLSAPSRPPPPHLRQQRRSQTRCGGRLDHPAAQDRKVGDKIAVPGRQRWRARPPGRSRWARAGPRAPPSG